MIAACLHRVTSIVCCFCKQQRGVRCIVHWHGGLGVGGWVGEGGGQCCDVHPCSGWCCPWHGMDSCCCCPPMAWHGRATHSPASWGGWIAMPDYCHYYNHHLGSCRRSRLGSPRLGIPSRTPLSTSPQTLRRANKGEKGRGRVASAHSTAQHSAAQHYTAKHCTTPHRTTHSSMDCQTRGELCVQRGMGICVRVRVRARVRVCDGKGPKRASGKIPPPHSDTTVSPSPPGAPAPSGTFTSAQTLPPKPFDVGRAQVCRATLRVCACK
jgi:hypothetical protein